MIFNKIQIHVDFVFKGDDDVLLNPKLVSAAINRHLEMNVTTSCPFTWGCKMQGKANRNPKSKYFTPEIIWEPDHIPDYFSGACYIVSGKLAVAMARIQRDVPIFPLDDVYIGILLHRLNRSSCIFSGKFCD